MLIPLAKIEHDYAVQSMSKQELVEAVAGVIEITKPDAAYIVDQIFRSIIDALNRGERVELRGFGSFYRRSKRDRMRLNPKTGQPVHVPARTFAAFRSSKYLKELVNPSAHAIPSPGSDST